MDKTIHYVGAPHTIPNKEYSGDAFSGLSITFCKMMKKLDYKIIFYGVEGGDLECEEYVTCLSKDEFAKFYPNNCKCYYQYDREGEGQTLFTDRCKIELNKRIPINQKQIVLCTWNDLIFKNNTGNMIDIDPHTGHMANHTRYRVYPSRTWRSFCYGLQKGQQNSDPYYYYYDDCVIPHYLDLEQYTYINSPKDNYILHLGRLNYDKGLYLIMDVAERLHIDFVISGLLDKSTEEYFFSQLKTQKYSHFVGYSNFDKKVALMRNALCSATIPLYNEPFGLVHLEAQSLGTPAVASNWGACTETILHKKTGFLCSIYEDVCDGINNCKDIKSLDCVNWIKSRFDSKVAAVKYDEYFQRIYKKEHSTINYWYDFGYTKPDNLYKYEELVNIDTNEKHRYNGYVVDNWFLTNSYSCKHLQEDISYNIPNSDFSLSLWNNSTCENQNVILYYFYQFPYSNIQNNIFLVPMGESFILSNSLNMDKQIKIISTSEIIRNLCIKDNMNYFHIKYFSKPVNFKLNKKNRLLYWNRRWIYSKQFLEKLCNRLNIEELIYIEKLDSAPIFNKKYDIPEYLGKTKVVKYNMSTSNEYKKLCNMCNYYLAPRLWEGIGMCNTEAIASGCFSLGYNLPELNTYVNSSNGCLFDIDITNVGTVSLEETLRLRENEIDFDKIIPIEDINQKRYTIYDNNVTNRLNYEKNLEKLGQWMEKNYVRYPDN